MIATSSRVTELKRRNDVWKMVIRQGRTVFDLATVTDPRTMGGLPEHGAHVGNRRQTALHWAKRIREDAVDGSITVHETAGAMMVHASATKTTRSGSTRDDMDKGAELERAEWFNKRKQIRDY